MNLAIIPARSGSKGLKYKNIALLKGIPLIKYTLDAAFGCSFIDRVVVSTDSEEIKKVCENYTHLVVKREYGISDDKAPLAPVIIDALGKVESFYGRQFKNIITLQPTSPLRDAKEINYAYLRFKQLKADSMLSVTEELHSIWASENGYAEPLVYSKVNRQEARPHYLGNGAIFITSREILLENRDRIGGKVAIHPMSKINSIDIHTQEDLELAEYYLTRSKK